MRASRKRLVLAADADHRQIERALHEGVLQRLVAFAVNLQLVGQSVDTAPQAAKALLVEMDGVVRQALDETTRLAQRISPPLLEAHGLAVMLRAVAAEAGVPASVDVAADASYPPEVGRTVYLCFLELLEQAEAPSRAAVDVHKGDDALTFEMTVAGPHWEAVAAPEVALGPLRDRVEALGGRLTLGSEPGRGIHAAGSLPLGR